VTETFQPTHSLLKRQIKKSYQSSGGFDISGFLGLVEQAYYDSDKERTLTDRSVSLMSQELLQRQKELTSAARRAGMSEVATNVLHNIGNILNSVNISIELIGEKLRKSKIHKVQQISDLLKEHTNDMTQFLTETEQGKTLVNYLIKIGTSIKNEYDEIYFELEQLVKNVEHIKSVIVVQQSISGAVGIIESVSITKVLDEVLDLNSSEFKAYKVIIEKEYDETPLIMVDRIKLEQILVNIIQNARDSLRESTNQQKKLTLSIKNIANDKIMINITDNGVGIHENTLKTMFSFGFTTKKTGHGFGLHSSAIAARELGGSISVTSEGVDKGATFSIELPCNPKGDHQK